MSASFVLLTSNSIYSKALANRIVEAGATLSAVFIEERSKKRLSLKDIFIELIGIKNYRCFSLLINDSKDKRVNLNEAVNKQKAISSFKSRVRAPYKRFPPNVKTIFVDSINEALEELLHFRSSYFLVFGTGIIKSRILDSINAPFINFHSSILPKYRGTFPEFWQVIDGDRKHTGYTIHLIDAGVDTGPILFQKRIYYNGRNPYYLRMLCCDDYINRISEILIQIEKRGFTAKNQLVDQSKARKYREITPEFKEILFLNL